MYPMSEKENISQNVGRKGHDAKHAVGKRNALLFPRERFTLPTQDQTVLQRNGDSIDGRVTEKDPYEDDIVEHFRKQAKLSPEYMSKGQGRHIDEGARSVVVDWLVQLHFELKLLPATLYLTVNLMDRFLDKLEDSRQDLSLIGVTSLWIASKYEEVDGARMVLQLILPQ